MSDCEDQALPEELGYVEEIEQFSELVTAGPGAVGRCRTTAGHVEWTGGSRISA